MSEEAPFPVDPVEPSQSSFSRSLKCELLALANASRDKKNENIIDIDSRIYQINLRVIYSIYRKWHSLDREKKRVARAIFEKIVEQITTNTSTETSTVNNINVVISSPIQVIHQHIEKTGVKELREKLHRYENSIRCVKIVLSSNMSDYIKIKSIEKCLNSIY